jgi:diguanylate cyclase (GGDEF)-like protein
MVDTASLRVAFGVVALTMLVLFYLVTYRSTRSAYCGWWCLSLALFMLGSAAYLLDGTVHQQWANPLGNFLIVLGAASVWAGARALRGSSPRLRLLLVGPAFVAVVSAFDHPADNEWSGGPFFLAAMWILVGMASLELWRLHEYLSRGDRGLHETYTRVVMSMVLGSGLFSLYYFGRWVAFVAVGPDAPLFTVCFGSAVTTLITMTLLAVVSFSMSSLSNEAQAAELRARATRDGLTGLFNRAEFLRLAAHEVRRMNRSGSRGALILADLDHFKAINDEFGHQAGDQVLQTFAEACERAVRASDLVGRYGGEEFLILLPDTSAERARQVAADISRGLARAAELADLRLPTASYGIAATDVDPDLTSTVAQADHALYRAKAAGRNRAVLHEPDCDLATGRPSTTGE